MKRRVITVRIERPVRCCERMDYIRIVFCEVVVDFVKRGVGVRAARGGSGGETVHAEDVGRHVVVEDLGVVVEEGGGVGGEGVGVGVEDVD